MSKAIAVFLICFVVLLAAQRNITTGRDHSALGTGTTSAIAPGALLAGQCGTGTVNVAGATLGTPTVAVPNTYPGDGVIYDARVTSTGVVTVRVCAIVALSPTSSTYSVQVLF